MNKQEITFANKLGDFLAPILRMIHVTGLFESYIFIPVITPVSIFLFALLMKVMTTYS